MISASWQACAVVFPFAISTSICRSKFTICSGLYHFTGMTGLPPGEFGAWLSELGFHREQNGISSLTALS